MKETIKICVRQEGNQVTAVLQGMEGFPLATVNAAMFEESDDVKTAFQSLIQTMISAMVEPHGGTVESFDIRPAESEPKLNL